MSITICNIENGIIANPAAIRKAFTGLQDGTYQVKISPRKVRSLQQNAYYWGVVCEMVKDGLQDVGYRSIQTEEDAHEFLKALFLKKQVVNEETGEAIEIHGSTATMLTQEFNFYIDQVLQWAAEYLGIVIPLPNEIL